MKPILVIITFCFSLFTTSCHTSSTQNEEREISYDPPVAFNPPTYVCYRAPVTITIDGVLSPEEWDLIPWASYFVDIEGDKMPRPYLQTRVKMTYDDEGFYIAALLEEPHVWADITEHDAVIYQNNNLNFS